MQKKQLFEQLLSCVACMRMALVHGMLPAGGRDLTIHFSPTRCHLAKKCSRSWFCVCCNKGKKKRVNKAKRSDAVENLGDDQLADDDEIGDFIVTEEQEKEEEKGPIIAISTDLCSVCRDGLRHYAHRSCLEELEAEGKQCPLCKYLGSV